MAAEAAVLVTIATSLASGLLEEVVKKAVGAASESSTVAGLKSALFGGSEPDLRRLEKELCKLDSVLRSAQSIDPMHRDNNDLLLIWLRDVKDAAFYADNLLDEIAYEKIRRKVKIETSVVAKLLSGSDTSFAFRIRIAGKIKEFVSLTAGIHKEAETTLNLAKLAGGKASTATYQPPSTTISVTENLREIRANPDTSIVVGREADEELIVTKLCSPHNDPDLPIVAIVGRSGVGKTTLARMIYENNDVCEHFGKRTWIFVSDNFKLERFMDEMLQSVTGQSHNLSNKGAMEDKLQQCLQQEKRGYLLVLDDVWNTDEQLWKSVESSFVRVTRSTRCRVLVTTQSFDIARLMCDSSSSTHELQDLGEDNAWELFKKLAFANKTQEQLSDLEDVGRRILSKCRGLPLAIKTLGSLLASRNEKSEWESVERSEIWGLSLHQSNIMPWLLISFHHLRDAAIKQCFVHCSVIIGKGEFVRQSEVIQAWMAQGFIQSTKESEMSMEDMGETYVSNLVANGLLQVDIRPQYSYEWIDGHVVCYLWMHDLVHDLARYISKATVWIPREACDLHTAFEAEHLRICGEGHRVSRYDLPKGKALSKLRTLICSEATLSVGFAAQAKFLRDLRLTSCGLEEVPSSIGRLKHLRYFSLCGNPFRQLPESIGTLFNLHTLNVEGCTLLDELPREITKLVNLRHILASKAYMEMPKGMGQLIHLRTAPPIVLGVKKGFEIKELKSLAFLSGYIGISGIEHISCKEDVVEASLKTKARITNLRLQWRYWGQRVANCSDEEIMDGLHPHSNLKGIVVEGFGGKRLSSWLLDMNNLKTVYLRSCYGCEQLTTLGQLGSLEELRIKGMGSLEVIGIEFYEGRATTSSNSHKNSDMSRRRILFPRLKHLRLENMEKLRDWVEPSGSIYEVFPCLEKLDIVNCPLLISAPTCFQSLLSLSIHNIRSGEAVMMILTNCSNLTDLDISGVDQLTSLSHPLLKCSHSLKNLDISDCKELGELCPTFQCMPSLEKLVVIGCDRLASIPDVEGLLSLRTLRIWNCQSLGTIQGLESGVSIEELDLRGNRKLELIPDLTNLSRLTSLRVVGFSRQMLIPEWLSCLQSLRVLWIGGFSEEVEQLDGATHLPKCLKELELRGWPKLNSLPSELQYLNQLERLCISGFEEIERIPEWLGCLSSLQELEIEDCKKLKYLPSLDAMRSLTRLTTFEIYFCPALRVN